MDLANDIMRRNSEKVKKVFVYLYTINFLLVYSYFYHVSSFFPTFVLNIVTICFHYHLVNLSIPW